MSTQGKRAAKITISLIAIGATVSLAIWVAIGRSKPTFDQENARLARAAASVFDQQRKIAVTDRSAVAHTIRDATTIPNQSHAIEPADDMRAHLAEFIAGWFEARADGDPETYARWAIAQGYRLSAEDPAWLERKRPVIEWMWQGYSKDPYPEIINPRAIFNLYYGESMKQHGGAIRPLAIANKVEVLFRLMRADMEDPFPLPFDDYPEMNLWSNWETAGDTDHWGPTTTYNDVLIKHGEAMTGIVAVAASSGRPGVWTPYTLACYYDPDAEQWHFLQVSTSNVTHPHVQIER
jgi:hypothetical protein